MPVIPKIPEWSDDQLKAIVAYFDLKINLARYFWGIIVLYHYKGWKNSKLGDKFSVKFAILLLICLKELWIANRNVNKYKWLINNVGLNNDINFYFLQFNFINELISKLSILRVIQLFFKLIPVGVMKRFLRKKLEMHKFRA